MLMKNLANSMKQNNRDSIRYNFNLCNRVWCTSMYNGKQNKLNDLIFSYSIPFVMNLSALPPCTPMHSLGMFMQSWSS